MILEMESLIGSHLLEGLSRKDHLGFNKSYKVFLSINLCPLYYFSRRKRDDGDTLSLNETAMNENNANHSKLSDWRSRLASKFKKSGNDQV